MLLDNKHPEYAPKPGETWEKIHDETERGVVLGVAYHPFTVEPALAVLLVRSDGTTFVWTAPDILFAELPSAHYRKLPNPN